MVREKKLRKGNLHYSSYIKKQIVCLRPHNRSKTFAAKF